MGTAENIELIKGLFERWNEGDRDVRQDEVDPDIEIHSRLTSGVYRGYDGVREWVAEIDDQFDQWRLNPGAVREAAGNSLLLLGDIHLRGRGSGVEFDQSMGWLFDFPDGRLLRMRIFPDRAEALAAAGLTE